MVPYKANVIQGSVLDNIVLDVKCRRQI